MGLKSGRKETSAKRVARCALAVLASLYLTLPLSVAKTKRIAVIGPNAAEVHLGGYSGEPGAE